MEKGETPESKQSMVEEVGRRAFEYESTHHGCSQCTMKALQEVLGLEDEWVFKAASCISGMFPVEGRTCGALTAGAMVMGVKYGRERLDEGIVGTARGMTQTLALVNRFKQEFGSTFCAEVSGGQTAGIVDEKAIEYMSTHPVEFEEMSREVIKTCAVVVKRTAEMVVEIISESG